MLQKPDQTAIATAAIGSSAVVAGQYALIILAALFGALVALSREQQSSKVNGAAFIFRAVSISVFMTMLAATWLSEFLGYPTHKLITPVAFAIAFVGDGWFRVRDWLLLRAKK